MDKKYEDWNKLFCDELCEEISKFEKCPTEGKLHVIDKLIEIINGLQEMEMDGAIRRIAEDRYGYDSGTGRFRRDGMERFGRDAEMEFIEMFNAARGRGRGRRRDSRGRFIGNMADPRYMPPYYPDMDDDGYPWERPYYMINDDKREYSADRFKRDGERSHDGMDKDDGMYMLRQKDGMPIMTPYNAHDPHDIPKKLTKQQYEEWMRGLVNVDGSQGPHWTKEQTKQVQQKKGLTDIDETAFWAAMNASYSDLCEFFTRHNLNQPETYADYATIYWFEDEDAVGEGNGNQEKIAAYYTAVVEH